MGVVGSLPSPPREPPSPVYIKTEISYENSIPSSEECTYCNAMTDEMDSATSPSLTSNIHDNNVSTSEDPQRITTYNILNKRTRIAAPTLATGRRSKFLKLEGYAAARREMRRKRNREAAKKLKEKRSQLEENLNNEINDLESKQKDLLVSIKKLETYKTQLEQLNRNTESIQEKLALKVSSTLKHTGHNRKQIHQSVPMNNKDSDIKNEPRSSSPNWQLLFSI